jgi:hypothetical protein
MMVTFILWTFAMLYIAGVFATIATVGKKREPISPAMATWSTFVGAVFVTALVVRLLGLG